ncbi:MAG: DUF4286 family protein [Bacteroidaceae bacterium]|nr:DUF4286 family protein [Bacteroidaceae bacterium]
MIIYNTTFQVEAQDAQNFVIFLHEVYVPAATESGELKNPRLTRILSHKDEASECFSLQFELESSATLHKWHTATGAKLNDELVKTFKDKVVGFPTLMEEVF